MEVKRTGDGKLPKRIAPTNDPDEKCCICLEKKRTPVALPCGHSLCGRCFFTLMNAPYAFGGRRCPLCRITIGLISAQGKFNSK